MHILACGARARATIPVVPLSVLRVLLLLCLTVALSAAPAAALDKVTLATNWKAEAEHGGFYQAIAMGIYTRDDQIRTYTFNLSPFLANKKAIQEGYLTSEPYTLQKAGAKPVVHILADHGFDSYSTTIECQRRLVETRPDLVQRFVDASIEGWYSYLYGDPAGQRSDQGGQPGDDGRPHRLRHRGHAQARGGRFRGCPVRREGLPEL
jgi:ABC-type nitrate/sulfonate/bicarbonate transport system substrate-binding protein